MFTKQGNASQVDVVLTNNAQIISSHCNLNCGISDVTEDIHECEFYQRKFRNVYTLDWCWRKLNS